MNVLYCDDILQFLPSYSDFKDLRWILVAGCISNNFLTYTAIMLNIVTLYAVRKSLSVPKTLRTLMLSLAISDVGVGVFIQPLYTSFLVTWLQMNNPSCSIYYLMAGVIRTLVNVSLFSVCSYKCGQVLSYSSSSQVQGTRNSQACCCGSDINLDGLHIFFTNDILGLYRYCSYD